MSTQIAINVRPLVTRLGWIGTGVMGSAMAAHLLHRGYRMTVYNRTQEKAQYLLNQGALWADGPRKVAESSDIVFTMVGYPDDVRHVYLGEEGVIAGMERGSVAVDMTTTTPALCRELETMVGAKEAHLVDAPVSGGDVGAQNATLSIMVGGAPEVVMALMPLFECMGKNIVYQGKHGAGQHAKLCNQIVIAGTMVGVCESLLYAKKSGLDLETMLRSIRQGAAGCWTLEQLAPRILDRNFNPGFYVDHFIKDMGIALDEASRMKLALPGLALVHQLYLATQAQGHGQCGTHALMFALEQLSGVDGDQTSSSHLLDEYPPGGIDPVDPPV